MDHEYNRMYFVVAFISAYIHFVTKLMKTNDLLFKNERSYVMILYFL